VDGLRPNQYFLLGIGQYIQTLNQFLYKDLEVKFFVNFFA